MIIPSYYKNKLYSEEERERLWIESLDQNIRYVDGQKIDISQGEQEYIKARQFARQKSANLGYGARKTPPAELNTGKQIK